MHKNIEKIEAEYPYLKNYLVSKTFLTETSYPSNLNLKYQLKKVYMSNLCNINCSYLDNVYFS